MNLDEIKSRLEKLNDGLQATIACDLNLDGRTVTNCILARGGIAEAKFISHAVQDMRDLIDAIENRWISVNDRLPECGRSVLAYWPGRPIDRSYRVRSNSGSVWIDRYNHTSSPTHWMPLPPRPSVYECREKRKGE